MGTKYSTQTASGYNASPPSDDGTEVSSNEVKWSLIKTKLADSVKDLADNINTNLLTHIDESVLDKATAYTTTAADHKRTINVTAAATQSLGDAATMAVGYIVTVKNSHSAAITVDLATGADTLDGTAAGSISLAPDHAMTFTTNSGADGYKIIGAGFGDDLIINNDLTVSGDITYDSIIQPKVKIINIGDWDMDTNQTSTPVAHGLTMANIRAVSALIRDDADTHRYDLSAIFDSSSTASKSMLVETTNITLQRPNSSYVDNVNYNATSFNRGWITITYV